jgi:hypothetical protein
VSGALAILRLLARPATLWNLLILGTFATVLGRIAWLLQARVDPASVAAHGANERGWQIAVLIFTGTLGGLLGWTVNELLLTPGAPLLPGLRRELRRGLVVLGGASATAAVLAYAAADGVHPWPVVWTLGAAAFGLCALVSDPLLPGSGWVVLLVALAELAWLPRSLQALGSAPFASSAALLALGLAGVELLLRPGALRRRPELPAADLGVAYRSEAATVNWTMAGASGQRLRVRLPEERLEGLGGWMRAAFLENFGWRRGGVAGAVCGHAAMFWTIFLLAAALAKSWLSSESREQLLPTVRNLMQSADGSSSATGWIATATALFWISNSHMLRTTTGYPLSRAQRARAVWWATLATNVGLHLALALVISAASLLVGWLCGESWLWPGSDHARVLALSLLFSPLVQGARVRFIDGKARQPTSLELGIVTGVAVSTLVVGLMVGVDLWRASLAELPPAAQGLTALALFGVIQAAWHWLLVRRFRTCELVT